MGRRLQGLGRIFHLVRRRTDVGGVGLGEREELEGRGVSEGVVEVLEREYGAEE